MEKNQLKWYEAPATEVIEMEVSAPLLAGSDPSVFPPTEDGGDDL